MTNKNNTNSKEQTINAIIGTTFVCLPMFCMYSANDGGSCIGWLFLSFFFMTPAIIAYKKGRSFPLWLLYGVCLWIVAIIHSLCIHDNDKAKAEKGWIKCPYCGEYSKPEASVCHCCGRELVRK